MTDNTSLEIRELSSEEVTSVAGGFSFFTLQFSNELGEIASNDLDSARGVDRSLITASLVSRTTTVSNTPTEANTDTPEVKNTQGLLGPTTLPDVSGDIEASLSRPFRLLSNNR